MPRRQIPAIVCPSRGDVREAVRRPWARARERQAGVLALESRDAITDRRDPEGLDEVAGSETEMRLRRRLAGAGLRQRQERLVDLARQAVGFADDGKLPFHVLATRSSRRR